MSKVFENCPNCGSTYDEIDYEYQICSLCGYAAKQPKLYKFYSKQYDLVNRLKRVTKGKHWWRLIHWDNRDFAVRSNRILK